MSAHHTCDEYEGYCCQCHVEKLEDEIDKLNTALASAEQRFQTKCDEIGALLEEINLLRPVAQGALPWFRGELGGLSELTEPMRAWVDAQGWDVWYCGHVSRQDFNIVGDLIDIYCYARNYWDAKTEQPPEKCHRCRQPRKDYVRERT